MVKSRQHLVKAVGKRRSSTNDPWTFTLLGFLLSIDSHVANIDLKLLLEGPEVIVVDPASILREPDVSQRLHEQGGTLPVLPVLDRVGAAFWEAAERREPICSIVFASMGRCGLTDVPLSWYGPETSETSKTRPAHSTAKLGI